METSAAQLAYWEHTILDVVNTLHRVNSLGIEPTVTGCSDAKLNHLAGFMGGAMYCTIAKTTCRVYWRRHHSWLEHETRYRRQKGGTDIGFRPEDHSRRWRKVALGAAEQG